MIISFRDQFVAQTTGLLSGCDLVLFLAYTLGLDLSTMASPSLRAANFHSATDIVASPWNLLPSSLKYSVSALKPCPLPASSLFPFRRRHWLRTPGSFKPVCSQGRIFGKCLGQKRQRALEQRLSSSYSPTGILFAFAPTWERHTLS